MKKDVSSPEVKKDLLRRVKNAISSTAERFSGYMQNVRFYLFVLLKKMTLKPAYFACNIDSERKQVFIQFIFCYLIYFQCICPVPIKTDMFTNEMGEKNGGWE